MPHCNLILIATTFFPAADLPRPSLVTQKAEQKVARTLESAILLLYHKLYADTHGTVSRSLWSSARLLGDTISVKSSVYGNPRFAWVSDVAPIPRAVGSGFDKYKMYQAHSQKLVGLSASSGNYGKTTSRGSKHQRLIGQ